MDNLGRTFKHSLSNESSLSFKMIQTMSKKVRRKEGDKNIGQLLIKKIPLFDNFIQVNLISS